MKTTKEVYLPTPEKILEELDKIRQTWSDKEEEKRRRGATNRQLEDEKHWTPPVINMKELFDRFGTNVWEV